MINIIILIVELVLILLTVQFIVAPIIIFFITKVITDMKLNIFYDENKKNKNIENIGFEYIGTAKTKDGKNDIMFSVYENTAENMGLMEAEIVTPGIRLVYFEFSKVYEDGFILDVNNSIQPSAFPEIDNMKIYSFKNVKDIKELFEITKNITKDYSDTKKEAVINREKIFDIIIGVTRNMSDQLLKKGYVKSKIYNDGRRALTLKGAYLMTWKLITPVKEIIEMKKNKDNKKYINQL